MDKGKAMKVMAESHRETVKELEDRIYAIGESYRQEREYNHKLEKRNKLYREALEAIAGIDHIEKCLDEEVVQVAREALEGDPHESI